MRPGFVRCEESECAGGGYWWETRWLLMVSAPVRFQSEGTCPGVSKAVVNQTLWSALLPQDTSVDAFLRSFPTLVFSWANYLVKKWVFW